MISALQEHSRKIPPPADASEVEMTSNYLEACHLIFEKGILSHMSVSPRYQRVIQNIEKGFIFFKDWCTCHENTGEKYLCLFETLNSCYVFFEAYLIKIIIQCYCLWLTWNCKYNFFPLFVSTTVCQKRSLFI